MILASDGLWDVMANEEVDPAAQAAAQAAAQYLSIQTLQKGSKDNITVVVVDVKAQRKIKTRTELDWNK
ncbi:Protein phosphatase 2C 16 [Striga hermonthica]|uniref:Protein phosphatase 2C 16 n=1 Tax=Striga hermonthica TaxID=68872 RepID=A0A9N7R6B7_STRHE|nr:Protein phosphatase 2C 16 [Striga hermonthica]